MKWDEIEAGLREDGFSLAAIAYAGRRYGDFGESREGWELEPSAATFFHFQEVARAYDAALRYPQHCAHFGRCYEPRLDAGSARWFRKCADGCGCPCHRGDVWLGQVSQ